MKHSGLCRFLSLLVAAILLCGMSTVALAETNKVELTVFSGLSRLVEGYEDNRFTNWYEEQTGVHINWIAYVDEIPTQFNLSIASGEFADVYDFTYGMTIDALKAAIDVGAAIPLDPYLEQYAPNYSKLLALDPELKKQMTAPDGHIYSFVNYQAIHNFLTPHKLWIFEPWLEASGLGMPTTLDELKELLIYFRDHDMNGNGDVSDEHPMVGCQGFSFESADPTVVIMDSFELFTDNFLKVDDNQVINCGAISDNWRAGLSYINKLYEEKLISPETFTQDLAWLKEYASVAADEQIRIGIAGGPLYDRWITPAYANAYKNYTYVPLLKKDAESAPQTLLRPRAYDPVFIVSSACEHPEVAVAWADKLLDPVLQITTAFGWEGEHWTRLSESEETGIVFQLTDKGLYDEGRGTQNVTWSPSWYETPTYQGLLYMPFTQKYNSNDYKKLKEMAAFSAYLEYAIPSGIPVKNMWEVDEDVEIEYKELYEDMKSYILQSYAEFITGVRDVDDDAAWQQYKDELSARGLERYIEVASLYFFGK